MAILHLTGDLMFSSRVSAAAKQQNVECLMAASSQVMPSPTGSQVTLVMIDLATPGLRIADAMEDIQAAYPDAHVVAYASHVHESTLAAARATGCEEVISRGEFNSRIDELVGRDANT